MIAEPLEKGLAEDIESEVVQITWTKLGNICHLFVLALNPSSMQEEDRGVLPDKI